MKSIKSTLTLQTTYEFVKIAKSLKSVLTMRIVRRRDRLTVHRRALAMSDERVQRRIHHHRQHRCKCSLGPARNILSARTGRRRTGERARRAAAVEEEARRAARPEITVDFRESEITVGLRRLCIYASGMERVSEREG